MSPVRHTSRRLAALVSARHACVADLAPVTPRGAIAWRASPFAAPGRLSSPRSFALAPRSAHRGFAAGARAWASAKGPGDEGAVANASHAAPGANAAASAPKNGAATHVGGSGCDGEGDPISDERSSTLRPERDAANPLAMILSAAMMCQYDLLQPELAKLLEDAVEAVLDAGYRTRDIVNEGNADETLVGCKEMGDLVAAKVTELAA